MKKYILGLVLSLSCSLAAMSGGTINPFYIYDWGAKPMENGREYLARIRKNMGTFAFIQAGASVACAVPAMWAHQSIKKLNLATIDTEKSSPVFKAKMGRLKIIRGVCGAFSALFAFRSLGEGGTWYLLYPDSPLCKKLLGEVSEEEAERIREEQVLIEKQKQPSRFDALNTLELPRGATQDEIVDRYRTLARENHPDKEVIRRRKSGDNTPLSTNDMKRINATMAHINEAYRILIQES